MRHPLSGRNLKFYLIVWALVIIAHTSFLHIAAGHALSLSFTDAVVFNLLLAGFGYIYWYVVKFLSPERQGYYTVFTSHAIGAAVGIPIIVYLSVLLLRVLNPDYLAYHEFLKTTFFWRNVVALFYLVLVIMNYYLLEYNSRIRQKEKDEAELQNLLRHAELETLKFQLNPHFIFNSLNSISALTISDPPAAQEMVIKLSDFLRTSLGKTHPEMHTLKEELEQMNLYLDIEKVRFGERLQVNKEVEEKCNDLLLPNMLLQPLFENAIKFGLYEQLEVLHIDTIVNCKEHYLSIQISNNFDPGMAPSSGKGIGLGNIANRLKLIYERDDLVKVKKENGIFEIQLYIPQV